jgi:site-specific DNA recombinase
MNPTKLIAVYARVSTTKQEEEQTIKNQLDTCKEFAQKHGYTIVKEYTDEGWSGDLLARPALDTLRQEAKSKIWDAVLIYDPDRLARRYSYQELVMDELREGGIEVLFVTVASPKNSEDKILHGVRGLFAEYERAKITERFRLGKVRKAKDGHLLIGHALYGYTYVPKQEQTHGYYVINEKEADVVRLIFNLVASGSSIRNVIKELHRLGVEPPKSTRGIWGKSTISRMLNHSGYIGEAFWGSTYGVIPQKRVSTQTYIKKRKSSRKQKPHEEWIIIPIPTIISKELFAKVQSVLKSNVELSPRNRKRQYLLSGKLFCSCGSKRLGECYHGNENRLYYRCSNRLQRFPLEPTCSEKSMRAWVADDLVWNKISELMQSPQLLQKQLDRWQANRNAKVRSSSLDPNILDQEITKLKKEDDRYVKAYGAGALTIEQLKEFTASLREKISNLQSQISEASRAAVEVITNPPTQTDLENFSKAVMHVFTNPSFDTKRSVILQVVDRITGNNESLEVYGHIPIGQTMYATLNQTFDSKAIQPQTLLLDSSQSDEWNAIVSSKEKIIRFEFSLPLIEIKYNYLSQQIQQT